MPHDVFQLWSIHSVFARYMINFVKLKNLKIKKWILITLYNMWIHGRPERGARWGIFPPLEFGISKKFGIYIVFLWINVLGFTSRSHFDPIHAYCPPTHCLHISNESPGNTKWCPPLEKILRTLLPVRSNNARYCSTRRRAFRGLINKNCESLIHVRGVSFLNIKSLIRFKIIAKE